MQWLKHHNICKKSKKKTYRKNKKYIIKKQIEPLFLLHCHYN